VVAPPPADPASTSRKPLRQKAWRGSVRTVEIDGKAHFRGHGADDLEHFDRPDGGTAAHGREGAGQPLGIARLIQRARRLSRRHIHLSRFGLALHANMGAITTKMFLYLDD